MIELLDDEFEEIAKYVQANYGINLQKKRELVKTRLFNLLTERDLMSYGDYFNQVYQDKTGKEAERLLNAITTNYTYFFREPTHFDFMVKYALPWLEETLESKDLRIWSAGCSTGEEPYSIVIQLDEYFGYRGKAWDKRILATDISSKALSYAKKGAYSAEIAKALSAQRLAQYFDRDDNQVKVKEKVKNEVIIRKFNLMNELFPFKKKFHIIFCRNVMIYFDEKTKIDLVNRFYEMTEQGGFLFIGHSESLHRDKTKYKYIKPAIYRKV